MRDGSSFTGCSLCRPLIRYMCTPFGEQRTFQLFCTNSTSASTFVRYGGSCVRFYCVLTVCPRGFFDDGRTNSTKYTLRLFLSKYIKSVSTYTRIRQFPRRSHRQVGVEIRISSTVHFMAS